MHLIRVEQKMTSVNKIPCCTYAFAIIFFLFTAGIDGADAADRPGNTLRITGSSTLCPLIAEVGKRFQTLHHDVRIDVQCGGSERGVHDVKAGTADIGMVSRALSKTEKDLYDFPMARDGISIIVSRYNAVKSLSNDEVVAIFSRKITSWKAVGGSGDPIAVVLREKQKSSSELFTEYFKMEFSDMKGKIIHGDNPVMIEAVASDRNSIGYVSSGHAARVATAGTAIKILPVNNVMPTNRNIITGNYPISRPLSLVTKDLPSGTAKAFIDFALSSSVVDLIVAYDYVPYED